MASIVNRPLRLYLDTSVPNFVFAEDAPDKQEITKLLFAPHTRQKYEFYISAVVIREIERAPIEKQKQLITILEGSELLDLTKETEALAQQYLSRGIIPKKSDEDARHVAIATIHHMDAVVSWNFKHLVNIRRIRLINLLNEELGYRQIQIVSPQEVILTS